MPRAGLTRAVVVDRAADIADAAGLENLTLSAVADSLGVAPPSLYKHVRGLEAMRWWVGVVGLRQLRDALAWAAVGRSGTSALRGICRAYLDFARAHPGRYAASLRAPAQPADGGGGADAGGGGAPGAAVEYAATAAEVLDVIFVVLAGYRLTGVDAVDAARTLRATLHGYVSLEAAGAFGLPRDTRHSVDRAIDMLDAAFRQKPLSRSAPPCG